MSFKVKHMMFGKIAIILCLCLVLNHTFIIKSYADESIATQNPLFIPISTLVTTVAVGSGIIAKNSADAFSGANQLVNNVVNNIKQSELAKKQADSSYVSPYKVINGQGQPEEPNDDNKNGKWVALGGGTLASGEIWANKEYIIQAMQEINDLKGYETNTFINGVISADNLKNQASASGISLQLAKISNSAVTQFDNFLHSNFWNEKNLDYNDCLFMVYVSLSDILRESPLYPSLHIYVFAPSTNINIDNVRISGSPFNYGTYNNAYGSISMYYTTSSSTSLYPLILDSNNVQVSWSRYECGCYSRNANQTFSYTSYNRESVNGYVPAKSSGSSRAYCGYKWISENPWQFTNNIYNTNQTFEVNFPDWLQESINILGQQIEGVRLGIQSLNNPWQPTQQQIQSGTSPQSVVYQFINNYENPENIPEEEEEPDTPIVVPPVIQEPQPTNDYLGNFLLPESITTKFPFCIPFDVARCLRLFSVSSREAPKWECDLNYGSSTYHVVIDLSMFNDVANFIRPLEYILFIVGLALGTRSLIRG